MLKEPAKKQALFLFVEVFKIVFRGHKGTLPFFSYCYPLEENENLFGWKNPSLIFRVLVSQQ
ncbi:MAG: hypothetical protein D6785_14575 [Planctomycetota bacterium]|nr:MAG: hypothetical protein D6785_14575 [Planctomycetota bacterium]